MSERRTEESRANAVPSITLSKKTFRSLEYRPSQSDDQCPACFRNGKPWNSTWFPIMQARTEANVAEKVKKYRRESVSLKKLTTVIKEMIMALYKVITMRGRNRK